MVERRIELNRKYSRKKKMLKLKEKLRTPGTDREAVLAKIKRLSPFWTEESLEQSQIQKVEGDAPKGKKKAGK